MEPEPTKLMLAGDWHHHTRWALRVIEHADAQGVDTILQLGDFGFWPDSDGYDPYVAAISRHLRDRDIRLFWVDGNHDNHDAIDAGQAADRAPIVHLRRGTRWRWWDKDWMAVGGGVSVDKARRHEGIDWFDREVLTPAELKHCCREGNVDIIVSHDCPAGVRIPGNHALKKQGLAWNAFPPKAIAESEAHRALLAEICESTGVDYLFHGHYHTNYCTTWASKTDVFGLADDGTSMDESTLILSKIDLP
jgi:predicted phosphodiesterase